MYTLPTNSHFVVHFGSSKRGARLLRYWFHPTTSTGSVPDSQSMAASHVFVPQDGDLVVSFVKGQKGDMGKARLQQAAGDANCLWSPSECFALSRFTIHLPQDELNEAVATLWDPQISPSHPGFKTGRNKNSKDRCLYLGWLRGGAMGQASPNHNKSLFHGDLLHGRLSEVYSILCGMECTSRSCLLWVCYIRCWVRWPRRKHIVIIVMWCEKRVQTFDSLLLYWISNFSGSCHVLHLVPVPMRRMCTSTWFGSLEVCPRRLAADLSWV